MVSNAATMDRYKLKQIGKKRKILPLTKIVALSGLFWPDNEKVLIWKLKLRERLGESEMNWEMENKQKHPLTPSPEPF